MIYFVGDGSAIKIGRTGDVMARMKELQCGNSRRLFLIGTVEGNALHECTAHAELDEFRVSGEWFRDCEEVRRAIQHYLSAGIEVVPSPPSKRKEEDEIVARSRDAAKALVSHEMREGYPKMVAYARVAKLVGVGTEWLRSFMGGNGEPRVSVGFSLLQHAHLLVVGTKKANSGSEEAADVPENEGAS